MSESRQDQELLRRLASLPREIRPASDPWPDILARISAPPAGWRRMRPGALALAASALLALAAGLILGPLTDGGPTPSSTDMTPTEVALTTPAEPAVARTRKPGPARPETGTASWTLAASEAEYQAAFREFIGLGESQNSLSPATLEVIQTNWAELQDAEHALQAALAVNPDNRFLNQRMLELRSRQLGFLKQLAALEQATWRLTI